MINKKNRLTSLQRPTVDNRSAVERAQQVFLLENIETPLFLPSRGEMTPLFDLPEDLFSNHTLQYLTAADLCRLRRVCRKFHGNGTERNVILKEFMARDEALTLSQQYSPNTVVFSIFDYHQRVLWFERCSAYAWEMTRQASRHQTEDVSCRDPDCKYMNLHARVPRIADGLRNGKSYMFFAQFTCQKKLLWEGFLQDYNPLSDLISPIRDLIAPADEEQRTAALADVLDDRFVDFYDNFVIESDVRFHLDARNVTNLTKDLVRSDLHVTLISLIYSPDGSLPELRLHYSSEGIQLEYPETPSPNHSVSIDVLEDQYVMTHYRKHDAYATPFLLWSAEDRLFTVSMLYNFEHVRDADQRAHRRDMDVSAMDLILAIQEEFLGNHHD
jgi:hypothetical protein